MKKNGMLLLALGMIAMFTSGISAQAMEDVYREPKLSGARQTWVYQGTDLNSSITKVFADDLEDGDLTKNIVCSGTVNTSVPGDYTLTYEVSDRDGKKAKLDTTVKVLPKEGTDLSDQTVQKILYTLPIASHLTNIGFNRGYYHDRQSLGIGLPADGTLRIRLVNSEEFANDLTLRFENDDSETESSASIPKDGTWATVSNDKAWSALFIETPKYTNIQPIIEYEWNDKVQILPYYRYGDSQEAFFAEWNTSNTPFAIVEGQAATFLIPEIDKNNIIHSPKRNLYDFETLDEMLEYYRDFVDQYDSYVGLDYYAQEPYNQNVRAKFFIKANKHGAGAAYYSSDHSASNGASMAGYLKRNWLSLHEFGHGYEGSLASLENPFVETTNNILGYYFESTYRPESDYGWLLADFSGTKTERYEQLGERAKNRRDTTSSFAEIVEGARHYNVSLFMFTNALEKLGPEKTVAAMHSDYRRMRYENARNIKSSDVIVESFAQAGGYNVVPYFSGWHIRGTKRLEDNLFKQDLPMVYYLKELIPDAAECEAVRKSLGLDGVYSLVETDDLADTGYTSQVNITFDIDSFDQIKGKRVLIKNGSKVVRELTVTDQTMHAELPVGIYEMELPAPRKMEYSYDNTWLLASKGSTDKTVSYRKSTGDPLTDDLQVQLGGIGNYTVASLSVDSNLHKLTWKLNPGQPHYYFPGQKYIGVVIKDTKGTVLYEKDILGDESPSRETQEFDFPEGSKIELYHREAPSRLSFVSQTTGEAASDYRLSSGNELTLVMTDRGLMPEYWSDSQRMEAYYHLLSDYSNYLTTYMNKQDIFDENSNHNEKMLLAKSYEHLDDASKQLYAATYGTLIGQAPASITRYEQVNSSLITGTADSQHPGNEAANALDGDPATLWHSLYSGNGPMPDLAAGTNNNFTMTLDKNRTIGKLGYLPRPSGTNGDIEKYEIYYSTTETGENFIKAEVKKNIWTGKSMRYAEFDAPDARRIRIKVSEAIGNNLISAAEFCLYEKYQAEVTHTYLSDLISDAENTSSDMKKDTNAKDQPISLQVSGNTRTFTKGLGLLTNSSASWNLEGKNLEFFSAYVGVESSEPADRTAIAEIYGDGQLLYRSNELKAQESAEAIYLPVANVKNLVLQVSGTVPGTAVSLGNAFFENSEDQTEITLKVGESAAILANSSLVVPDRGKITWTTDNETIAKVDEHGVVSAIGEGTASIKGISSANEFTCILHVEKAPEESDPSDPPTTPGDDSDKDDTPGTPVTPGDDSNKDDIPGTPVTPGDDSNKDDTPGTPSNPGNPIKPQTQKAPGKVVIKKLKAGKHQVTLSWKKMKNITGYEIWMKKDKKKFKKLKTLSAKKQSIKIKKLKKGKYSFKIRAFSKKAAKKQTGKYSKIKTVRVK